MNKLIRREQLFHLISAHFKEVIREPEVLFWGIIFPMLMSLGLGIAFTKKVDIVRNVALIDPGRISMSAPRQPSGLEIFLQRKAEKIQSDPDEPVRYKITIKDDQLGNTTFLFQKTGWENAMTLMKRGNLSVVITETDGRLQYHFDPSNSDAQLTYLKLSKILGGNASPPGETTANIKALTVRGTRYIDFLVPGSDRHGNHDVLHVGHQLRDDRKTVPEAAAQNGSNPHEEIPSADGLDDRSNGNEPD